SGPSEVALPAELAKHPRTASEVFLALLPDSPVPDELIELDWRQNEMAALYTRLAEARTEFPQFQHPPERDVESLVGDSADVGVSIPDFASDFGQIGSALDGASCF